MPTPDLTKAARDFIIKMQPKHAKQVLLKIIDLCQDPEPPDSKLIKGSPERFRRADFGEFRIIYKLEGDILKIYLIGKKNDDEIFKQLKRR